MMARLDYASARQSSHLQESPPANLSEIEVQARLFSGAYGSRWRTTRGEMVEVVHFGEWNRESGPDFKGVLFRFEKGGEKIGDLEVDWDARDWERHGHATNPAFASVQLQLFVSHPVETAFARTVDHREVAQARLEIEGVGVSSSPSISQPVDLKSARVMIDEAAEFRLRAKHSAFESATALHGPERALFYTLASGLGYKNNSTPFLLAAQRIGLRDAGSSVGEALLFGVAGFLEPRSFDDADEITRRYLKPLWDHWWTVRDALSRLVLPSSIWKMSGLRPSNHPHRRLGALFALARDFNDLQVAIRNEGSNGFLRFFETLSHPYWSHHWNLRAAKLGRSMALVGADRAGDLMINALLPSMPLELARHESAARRGPYPSGRVLKACEWLVGADAPVLRRTAKDHQGLLQLFSDFSSMTALEAWAKIRGASFNL